MLKILLTLQSAQPAPTECHSTAMENRNQGNMEWLGLEGTLRIVWFQLDPCHVQGHLLLEQGGQSPTQCSRTAAVAAQGWWDMVTSSRQVLYNTPGQAGADGMV